jgi:hypothetical protein
MALVSDAEIAELCRNIVEDAIVPALSSSGVEVSLTWQSDTEFSLAVPLVEQVWEPAFDMKPRLLKHARHAETTGTRYQIIPFYWMGSDGNLRSGSASPEDRWTKFIVDAMTNTDEIGRMLPAQREELLRQFSSLDYTGSPRGYASYTWARSAGSGMLSGRRYYRQFYRGRRFVTLDDGERGQGRVARAKLSGDEGITFRTVTDQPNQAAAWWYPGKLGWKLTGDAIQVLKWLEVL